MIFVSLVIMLSIMVFELSVTRVGMVIIGNALLPNSMFLKTSAEWLEESCATST